ncbi:MAG TPA: hypothetical protein VHO91_22820 [Rhodopila sp.]|nr:hypothetical protein [Rhodopila sp.]
MQSTPLYAPDGMRVSGSAPVDLRRGSAGAPFSAVRERMDVVLPHDRHDDGLVHAHAWAVTTADRPCDSRTGYFETAVAPIARSATANPAGSFAHMDDRYDDGLVHNHDWAVSGK